MDRHGRTVFPREACGLLLGTYDGDRTVVAEAVAARNLAPEADRFELDPQGFADALRRADSRGLEIVGCYHSHPSGRAVPSKEDHAAAQPGWSHVILAVTPTEEGEPEVTDRRSCRLGDEGRLTAEAARWELGS